jgi:hypothetical protein
MHAGCSGSKPIQVERFSCRYLDRFRFSGVNDPNQAAAFIRSAGATMGQNTYQVIYKGEILEGYDKQTVLRKVAQILSISAETTGKVLNGKRVVLRKGLDEATARSLCIQLKQAGMRVALGVPQPDGGDYPYQLGTSSAERSCSLRCGRDRRGI